MTAACLGKASNTLSGSLEAFPTTRTPWACAAFGRRHNRAVFGGDFLLSFGLDEQGGGKTTIVEEKDDGSGK